MSILNSSIVPVGSTGYDIPYSARFNDDDSAYLSRTISSASNRRTFTISVWAKRGNLGNSMQLLGARSGSTFTLMYFSSHHINFYSMSGGNEYQGSTNAIFRDPSAWYHIVVAVDTTQGTQSNRVKIYINGVQQSMGSNNYPQNYDTQINSTLSGGHQIGRQSTGADHYDGYLAEVNFIDGQALTPADFGETDATYGHWKAIEYTGSYGTNGFYLDFSGSGTKHTITANGNTNHSTAQSKIGATGIYFDGTDDYLTVPDSDDWDWAGDFTIETWFRADVLGSSSFHYLFDTNTTGDYFSIAFNASNKISWVYNGGPPTIESSSTFSATTWYHLALVKNGSTTTLYVDGASEGTYSDSNTYSIDKLWIGAPNEAGYRTTGFMDEIRISNTARYTSSFTPSTTAFTDDSNTLLLIHSDTTNGSTTFTDSSGVIGGLGNDQSGTANHWTPNNLVATDQMLDSPTNNFCTMNPLDDDYAGVTTFSEGNLKTARGTNHGVTRGTIGMSSSKWYMECLVGATTNGSSAVYFGVVDSQVAMTANISGVANCWVTYSSSSNDLTRDGAIDNIVGVFTAGDILQIALDLDAGKIWIGKNNVWWDSANGLTGNPSAGTNEFDTVTSSDFNGDSLYPAIGSYANNAVANFGQDSSFAGNKTAQGNADGNGYGDFYYAPPTDFLALCTQNLPEPTVVPSEHFNTVLYTGNGTNNRAITGVGFAPDFSWLKSRPANSGHNLSDSVRGDNKTLQSHTTNAEGTLNTILSLDSDGFTVGTGNGYDVNKNGESIVAWNWKANGTGASNTNGSITSTVSANADAGFSIVSYTGNATNAATVGHGLSVSPEMVIVKNRDRTSNWHVGGDGVGTDNQYIDLNRTAAIDSASTGFQGFTSTVFQLGTDTDWNANGEGLIAYCFHSVDGYSKVGSYTGNGSTDGTFVHCGFRPAYVMIKQNGNSGWMIYDSKRSETNQANEYLQAQVTNIEVSSATDNPIDFLSNGIKMRYNNSATNYSNGTFIFLAFAETPFKHTNAR